MEGINRVDNSVEKKESGIETMKIKESHFIFNTGEIATNIGFIRKVYVMENGPIYIEGEQFNQGTFSNVMLPMSEVEIIDNHRYYPELGGEKGPSDERKKELEDQKQKLNDLKKRFGL